MIQSWISLWLEKSSVFHNTASYLQNKVFVWFSPFFLVSLALCLKLWECPSLPSFLSLSLSLSLQVHVGDFRAAPSLVNDPVLAKLLSKHKEIDTLYLDTTYCKPRWIFPSRAQPKVLELMRDIVRSELESEPKTLFLCGAYTIGKENAIKAVTQAANSKVCVCVCLCIYLSIKMCM